MSKKYEALLEEIKKRICQELPEMSLQDKEEFFDQLSDWSGSLYDKAIWTGECEMQSYDE